MLAAERRRERQQLLATQRWRIFAVALAGVVLLLLARSELWHHTAAQLHVIRAHLDSSGDAACAECALPDSEVDHLLHDGPWQLLAGDLVPPLLRQHELQCSGGAVPRWLLSDFPDMNARHTGLLSAALIGAPDQSFGQLMSLGVAARDSHTMEIKHWSAAIAHPEQIVSSLMVALHVGQSPAAVAMQMCSPLRSPADREPKAEVLLTIHRSVNPSELTEPLLKGEPMLQFREDGWLGVSWRTRCNLLSCDVLVGPAPLEPSMNRIESREMRNELTTALSPCQYVHALEMKQPLSDSFYRLRCGATVSTAYRLQSRASVGRSAVKVALLSDSQSGAQTFRHLLAHVSERRPNVFVHGGDAVQSGTLAEWENYFVSPLTSSTVAPLTPMLTVRGNHDGELANVFAGNPHGRTYYAVSVATARFVVLDSNIDRSRPDQYAKQLQWLKEEFQSAEYRAARFHLVFVHVAPFVEYWNPEAWNRGESNWGQFLREDFVPLFEANHVALVISGHSHVYQRGQRNGVRYALIGGGGGQLETERERVQNLGMYDKTFFVAHYVMLSIPGIADPNPVLQWQAFDTKDASIDSFKIGE